MWKLNKNRTRVKFEKRVKELVSTDAPDLWKIFRDGVLKACEELCGKKKSREIKETCGGGMKRSRIPQQERRRHLKSCADSHQNKIKLNTNV